MASGLFGALPTVPFSSSAGLIAVTGLASRLPFLFATVALGGIALVPSVVGVIASIPVSVGDAVLFAVFAQMFGAGIRAWSRLRPDPATLLAISMPTLFAIGLMVLPSTSLSELPLAFRYLFGNGLMVGIVLVALSERMLPGKRADVA